MTAKLTETQYQVLGIVDGHGPITAREVNRHLPIGIPSARSALSSLERKGYVSANYTADVTARSYEITDEGRAALAVADEVAGAELNALMAMRDRRKRSQ